jgi:hypothetical protein
MKTPSLFRFGLLAALAFLAQSAPAEPVVPLSPSKLLDQLPKAPAGWTLKTSQAFNDYLGWPVTTARRDFQGPPPPPAGEGEPPPPPPEIRIRFTDTGKWPARLAAFAGFAPGKSEAGEKLFLDGIPAISRPTEAGTRTTLCVAGRFLVVIESRHLEKAQADEWIKNLDLAALARLAPGGETTAPRPLKIIRIDQIHPAMNRSRDLYWSTEEELLGTSTPQP